MFHADSRFLGFKGSLPPLLISGESFARFHNCTFEDIDLRVEVFDVSLGGMLRLEECYFHNVSLARGKLVSTTLNDVLACDWPLQKDFFYLPDDDVLYDIPWDLVDTGNAQGGYFVENETLSDCLRQEFR